MNDKRKGLLFQTKKQMNNGAIATGLGFVLYLALLAMGPGAAGGLGGRCLRRGGNFQLPLRAGGAAQGQGEYLLQSAVGTAGADHLPGGLRGAGRQATARAVKGKRRGIRWIPAAFSYSETVSSSKVGGTSTGAGAPSGSSWRLTFFMAHRKQITWTPKVIAQLMG